MAKQKIIEVANTPEQEARTWAAGLESIAQVIGWIQTQDQDAVAAAKVQLGKPADTTIYSFADYRAVAEKVYLWKLSNPSPSPGVAGATTVAPPAESATPAAPLSEIDQLRHRVKTLELAEESRQTRQKKMQTCLTRIDKAESGVRVADASLEDAKGNQKSAIAELAHALNELKLTAKNLPIQLDLPLASKPAKTSDAEAVGSTATPAATTPPVVNHAEEWRGVILHDIGVPEGVVKKLAEHEPSIVTLGELTDWQAKKGEFWAKDIKGIGGEKAEAIAKACEKYWAEHPQPTSAAA